MKQLKKRDMELLKCLRTNARLTLTQISKQTRIPISTLYERLKAQEKEFINKHTTLIDFSQLGFNTRLQLLLKAPKINRDQVASYLKENEHINTISKISSNYNLFVEAIFERVQDANMFVEELETKFPQIESSSHYVIQDVKREAFLSNERNSTFG